MNLSEKIKKLRSENNFTFDHLPKTLGEMVFSAGLLSTSMRPSFKNAFNPFLCSTYIQLLLRGHFLNKMVMLQPSKGISLRLASSAFDVFSALARRQMLKLFFQSI